MAKTEPPPLCPTCNENYSIKHIVHCPNFNEGRKDFTIPDNMYEAIDPFSNYQNIILYLKKIELSMTYNNVKTMKLMLYEKKNYFIIF
jgi:hypothetical protein